MKIICDCGHNAKDHSNIYCRCLIDISKGILCPCRLSQDAVEARYWARHIMKEKKAWQTKYNIIVAVLKSMGFWDETCDYSMERLDKD